MKNQFRTVPGLIAGIAIMYIFVVSTTAETKQETLKIVDWNTLVSFNHKRATDAGAQWIKNQAPDVVALQELNGNTAEGLKKMAEKWGHKYAVILKEKGFPVGLTSTDKIEVIEKRVKGFHHGYLHARTHGIDFFVVHFWPGKDHEADVVIEKIKHLLLEKRSVIVCGDFNTHSRHDKEYLAGNSMVKPVYDFVDKFEQAGFVDIVYKHSPNANYSFPSPIIIPRWVKTMEEVKNKRQRIDFVFADHLTQKSSISGVIMKSAVLDKISDHYPLVAEFHMPEKPTSIRNKKTER